MRDAKNQAERANRYGGGTSAATPADLAVMVTELCDFLVANANNYVRHDWQDGAVTIVPARGGRMTFSLATPLTQKVRPMSESKHTPGPWTANSRTFGDGDSGANISVWSEHGLVATAATIHEGAVNAEANARLIAAAPDLEACLKDLVQAHDTAMGKSAVKRRIDLARAAIAEAEYTKGENVPSQRQVVDPLRLPLERRV